MNQRALAAPNCWIRTLETALHNLFVGMIIAVPVGWACSAFLLILLKTRHPDIFESLGEPCVLPSRRHMKAGGLSFIGSQIRAGKYLLSMRWMLLDDLVTEAACWVWLVFHLAFCIAFVVLFVLAIIVENKLL